MKLRSIQVQNYRSISDTNRLPLEDGLTVILGPNNEGKSNLLRAIVLAMECLRSVRMPLSPGLRSEEGIYFRLIRNSYEWENDFPQKLQEKQPDGHTILTLEFDLSDEERKQFKKACGSAINDSLPIEIRVNARGAQFKVKKPGRGAKTYEAKSREIARFVSNTFDFQYIPAIRPSQLSLDVVASLMERELSLLSENQKYKTALKTIEDIQRPVFEQLEADVQTYLKQLLPSVKAVKIRSSTVDGYRGRMRLPQFVVDDGTATDLEAKGDGIKSLVAISLMRASKTGGGIGDLVVAIEEPESHLHPGAVRQLALVLQEMANEHQVIITTHSPLLVARNRMEANIIVSRSKATPATSIKSVRESLGVQVEDNLSTAEYVILVEGPTDVLVLSAVFSARSSDFADLVAKGKVIFDHMGGVGNIVYKIRTLQLAVASPLLIVDDDKAGRECAKKARNNGALPDKYHFSWKRPKANESELEDLICVDCYWDSVQKECGVTLNRSLFDATPGKWVAKMERAFNAGGKPWTSSVESNVKDIVARSVAANPIEAIDAAQIELVDNVLCAIVKLICNR